MAKLIVSEGEQKTEHQIKGDVIKIGRARDNDVQILDIKCSKNHCQIEHTPTGYKLIDLESQNGTKVNGVKVNQQILSSGDKIEIGSTIIFFQTNASDELKDTLQKFSEMRRKKRIYSHIKYPRRKVFIKKEQEEVELEDELLDILENYFQEGRVAGLEEAFSVLEEFYESKVGTSRMKELLLFRDNLIKLQEVNKLINSEHNLDKLLDIIMDATIEFSGAERGFLILIDEGKLNIKVARKFDKENINEPEFQFSHSIAQKVISTGKFIVTADALKDERFAFSDSISDLQLHSVLCMPLKIKDKIIGCFYLDNTLKSGLFKEIHLQMLSAFSDQAAIAIENARLVEALTEKTIEQSKKIEVMTEELKYKQDVLEHKYDYRNIIGNSSEMHRIFSLLDRVIETDLPVLIEGESGTGKELIARAVHFNSNRKKAKFVSENCAAIPDQLLESELFGYMKGAFTGAVQDKKGLFEIADGGTLFLDEISDMSQDMQKKLLRVIQEGEFRRIGGKDTIKVNVRIISATNKNLLLLVKDGKFREDLYYRLNVIKIKSPPLRERKSDIKLLVEHFLRKISEETKSAIKKISPNAIQVLERYDWPGNVRELESEIRRAWALCDDTITIEFLRDEIRQSATSKPTLVKIAPLKDVIKETVENVEKNLILAALRESNWVKTEAAKLLDISRPTLDAKIEAYNLNRFFPK